MVNPDLLFKNATSEVTVSAVLDTVLNQLGRLFASKLLDGGHAAAAEWLTLEEAAPDQAEQYRVHLDCPLFREVETFVALRALEQRHQALEAKILELLASRARRELNVISEDPPLATRLAREIETFTAGSPRRGPHSLPLAGHVSLRLDELFASCGQLLNRGHLSWNELTRAQPPKYQLSETLAWATRLAQGVAQGESLIQRLEPQFGRDPVEETDEKYPKSYRQILKFKNKSQDERRGRLSLTRAQKSEWHDDASQLLAEHNFLRFATCVDAAIETLEHTLAHWQRNEIARGARQKSRLLEVENFHYADGVRRNLHQLGESLEDALSCAEKLLTYCQENQVSASELMDDEIWSLFPRINRENLKQARLKVRHSDMSFPLSVAHREWITQVTQSDLTSSV